MSFRNIPDLAIRQAMRFIAYVLAAGRLETKITGTHHIPLRGPVILVARHYHHLFDGVALYKVVPRQIHILVTLDWAQNRIIRRFMEWANHQARWPVVLRPDALSAKANEVKSHKNIGVFTAADIHRYQRKAMRESIDLLLEGKALVIFPEGYPNIDPNYTPKKTPEDFLSFKTGFAAIAVAAEKRLGDKIPIIPVGLSYQRNHCWIGQINFGRAVFTADFASRSLLVKSLEEQVVKLSGLQLGQEARGPGAQRDSAKRSSI